MAATVIPIESQASTPQGLTDSREWVSFEHNGDTYLFDVSFLESNWTCIFGAGCHGVLEEDATDLGHGCCSHGAHFADKADRKRIAEALEELSNDEWQLREVASELGGAIQKNESGDWVTIRHDGACIFLNRTDFAAGAGCALHAHALAVGDDITKWKPEVCWQLPLRLHHHVDEVGHTTWTLKDWKRRDWGDGGADFMWWCTESEEAFVGHEAFVLSLRAEIVALIGEEPYERLVDLIAERMIATPVAIRRK